MNINMTKTNRTSKLIEEILNGEYRVKRFQNAEHELAGEYQAVYFSHARDNMNTDIAHTIMFR